MAAPRKTSPGPADLCAAEGHDWLDCDFKHLDDDPALRDTARLMQLTARELNRLLDNPKQSRRNRGPYPGRDLIKEAGIGHSSLNSIRHGKRFVSVLVLNRVLWQIGYHLALQPIEH